jgi:hypothetical protein
MQAICKKYMYNHVHNATLLQDIMKELAGADGVRKLNDTPAPGTGTVHSVADSVSHLQAMMDADTDTDYSESAYAGRPTAIHPKRHASHVDVIANPNHVMADMRRTRKVQRSSMRRTPVPIARNSTAPNPMAYSRINACGTRNIRGINSSPFATN